MKSTIVAISLLIPLAILFVIIDHKDFYSGNEEAVQQETVTGKKGTTGALIPFEKSTETKTVAGKEKTAETKLAETKSVVETKPVMEENSRTTIPVVTMENAEKPLVKFEKTDMKKLLHDGYGLTYTENFKEGRIVSISNANEGQLLKKGYNLDEFKMREIPKVWNIDFSTIPSDTFFSIIDDGFCLVSNQGPLRLICKRFDGMRSSFIFEFSIKNTGDEECDVVFGVHNSGLIKSGFIEFNSEKIPPNEERQFEAELSVFEQLTSIAPTLSIQGKAVLSNFNVYQKIHDDFSIVEGEITERSTLPNPKDTDYPNCRYTAHFIGNAIISGLSCNKELSLSIDGFKNKKVLKTNSLKCGDKVKCAIVPIDSIPDDFASIQEADELSLFTLDSYLVTTVQIITSYTDTTYLPVSSTHFKSEAFEFKSVFEENINPSIPANLVKAQNARIRKDLEEANAILATYEITRDNTEQQFQDAWTKEKERFPDDFNTIKSGTTILQHWRNVNHSFWCLPPRYTLIPKKLPTISDDKLNALIAFKDFLESNGIQLIVSLVPDRYEIAARVINSDFSNIPVYQLLSYVKQLSEAGIECPYYPTNILKHYDLFPFAYSFPNDGHCNSSVQYSIAEILADRLSPFCFSQNLERTKFSHVQAPTFYDASNHAHKYPGNCDIEDHEAGTCYSSDEIHYDGKVLTKDPDSPILVVGNSFMQTPMGTSQNSLPAFLAERMLCTIDDYRVDQKGPMTTIIQRFFDNPKHYLKGKKVLIMQVASGYLADNSFTWNNIRSMDEHRMLLNDKKLVATLSIKGEGNYASEINNSDVQTAWERFPGKREIYITSVDKREILHQTIEVLDTTKPFVCIVSTVRSSFFSFPTLTVNGISEPVPAGYAPNALSWQDVYFSIPYGTDEIVIELQGKNGTIVGFSQVQIYQ